MLEVLIFANNKVEAEKKFKEANNKMIRLRTSDQGAKKERHNVTENYLIEITKLSTLFGWGEYFEHIRTAEHFGASVVYSADLPSKDLEVALKCYRERVSSRTEIFTFSME